MTDAELVDAYLRTVYEVRDPVPIALRIGEALPRALASTGILTAFNPLSTLQSAEENRTADERLGAMLRDWSLPFDRTVARDPDDPSGRWEEPGYLIRDISRGILIELGHAFSQNAVVWTGADGRARLLVTRSGFAGLPAGAEIASPLRPPVSGSRAPTS